MRNILTFALILLSTFMFAQTNYTAVSYIYVQKNVANSVPTQPLAVNIPLIIDIVGKKVSVLGTESVNLSIITTTSDITTKAGDKYATYNAVNASGAVCYIMRVTFKIPKPGGNDSQLYLTYADHADVYDFKS